MRMLIAALAAAVMPATVHAQVPAEPKAGEAAAPAAQPSGPLAPFAWLEGCWRGSVADREFREQWLPLRGDMMIGVSHTVLTSGKTQDYEFLRIEARADGAYYVALTPPQSELAFRFAGSETDSASGHTLFKFDSARDGFPQRIVYRRGHDGWLYAQVDGKVQGNDRSVIYPMRRVDCETGELIQK